LTLDQRVMTYGLRLWRAMAGHDSSLERGLKRRYREARAGRIMKKVGPNFVQHGGKNFVVIESRRDPEPRVGIALRGGCDLPSMFAAAPFIQPHLEGTVAIFKQGTGGELGAHRSDQILQTLHDIPADVTETVRERLGLESSYFSPQLFEEKDFEIDGFPQFGRFPKSVVVLSIGSDLARTMYRHREYGFLVDPGGFWLGQLVDRVIPDPTVAKWFKDNFENVGKISVEESKENYRQIIPMIRERTGAEVIIYNSLVVDPGSATHNYQLLNPALTLRRRQFQLALMELSAELDFPILDMDRILKRQGVQEQVDFAHVPFSQMQPIGREVHRILTELGVV
jgi:hypothetical protein